jgi:apolipoprotein N-acyltransferase
MLVTPTNDAWFNESSELKAHFACAVFRAVENRRWTVQSANGGISGLISPNGVIVASLNGEGVVSEDAFLQTALSLYTRFGDWVVLMLAGALVAVILICRLIARKKCGGKIA